MSEQTPANNSNGQAQQEPSFNAHDMVTDMLSGIRNSLGAQSDTSSDTESADRSSETIPPTEQVAPQEQPAPQPPEEGVDHYKAELDRAHKTINGIQSSLDKRIAASQKPLLDQIQTLTNTVQQLYSHIQRQNAPEEWQQQQQIQEQQQHTQQTIEQLLEHKLNSDPRVQAGSVVYDWAAYRQARPDMQQFDPLVSKFLERFPPQQGERLYDKLMGIASYIDDLKELAVSGANGTGEATRNTQPQPTQQPSQPPFGKVTQQQAAAIASKANAYRQEQGQSATQATKPAINYGGRLDSTIDAIVENYMRGRR